MWQKKSLLFVVILVLFFSFNFVSWGQVKGNSEKAIGAGRTYTCALTQSGGVKCWGSNDAGQLGDKTNDGSNAPVDVYGLSSGVKAIAVGGHHACALTNSGAVKCWGGNSNGQLGDGTNKQSNTPVEVYSLSSGITAISAGVSHTCALTDNGAVKCWGHNYGQLGDGTFINRNTPVDVFGLSSGVKAVTTGFFHTCAVTQSGAVKCWGNNAKGQLGDGTNNKGNINTPVDVSGLSNGVTAISAGDYHTCALTQGGAVKCWGRNTALQLGNGTYNRSNTPVDVLGEVISNDTSIKTLNKENDKIIIPVQINCQNFQIEAIGVHEGSLPNNRSRGFGEKIAGYVDVNIGHTDVPVKLVLSSYEPVIWRLHISSDARLSNIYLSGSNDSRVEGIQNIRVSYIGDTYAYKDPDVSSSRHGRMPSLAGVVKQKTGCNITKFQGVYKGSNFYIGYITKDSSEKKDKIYKHIDENGKVIYRNY